MAVQDNNNPLRKYFRQPKIYLKLPSRGKYYAPGSIDLPENGELPIFAMTAKDELMFKTPDALINGEATVEVIKSCVPNIRDPWKMPSIDNDAILIAIRMATFGEKLEISTKVPNTGEDKDFEIDLRMLLEQLLEFEFDPFIQISDEMTIEIKPTTYREFTDNALKTFEEQRIFKVINDDSIPDDQKLVVFAKSFRKLTEITIDLVVNSVACIDTPDGRVTDKRHIRDFFSNADRDTFDKVMKHLETIRNNSKIKPLVVNATPEEIEAGVPETYEIPITFDQSNFFA
jgi:transposase-like protein